MSIPKGDACCYQFASQIPAIDPTIWRPNPAITSTTPAIAQDRCRLSPSPS